MSKYRNNNEIDHKETQVKMAETVKDTEVKDTAVKNTTEKNTTQHQFGRKATALIHGGVDGDVHTGAVNVPIYQTSTFQQVHLGQHKGYEYSRTGNPTREALEKLISSLEHGNHGLAFASGMAAITAVLSLFHSGDKILISENVYGGTFRVLHQVFDHFGITSEIVDTTDPKKLEAALTVEKGKEGTAGENAGERAEESVGESAEENAGERAEKGAGRIADKRVKAVLIESPANPLMTVTDIAQVAQLAHQYGKLLIVDNTFMTPYLQRPLELGADIVVHSATKYLGGHSDLIAGLVVVRDEDLAQQLYFIQNSTGGILQPFDSFLLIRGIKTLGVRMDRHQSNAQKIAEWLDKNPSVKNVYYPGLSTDPGYELQRKQADGPGAMISFELQDQFDIRRFFDGLHLIALAESLGGVESLVCHPSSMTHASIPEEIRHQVGITDNLIRLSVGIEDVKDLIEDLDVAIRQAN